MSVSKNAYDDLKASVASELKRVNSLIVSQVKSKVKKIPDISNYLTGAGGKRLRPVLTLACSKLFNGINEKSIKLATSVEYIHAATLLHDDVIDESEKRRGKPTANRVWDNKTVVLVGDFLFSQSFKLMVAVNDHVALKVLSDVSADIVESEVWQLELINNLKLSEKDYIELIKGKTAKLFAAACKVGGIVSGASEKETKLLEEFGMNLGICFQIVDDLLDYTAQTKDFGKKVGNDFLEGKVTLPIIFALKKNKKFISTLLAKENKQVADYTSLKNFLEENHIADLVTDVAKSYSKKAKTALQKLPQTEVSSKLLALVEFLIHRTF